MEVYNKEYQHHCPNCEFQALEEYFLKEHIEAFHKPKLSCRKCFQQFFHEDELTIHIENNHEETMYQCNQCEYKAKKKDILDIHIKSSHSNLANHSDPVPVSSARSRSSSHPSVGL